MLRKPIETCSTYAYPSAVSNTVRSLFPDYVYKTPEQPVQSQYYCFPQMEPVSSQVYIPKMRTLIQVLPPLKFLHSWRKPKKWC